MLIVRPKAICEKCGEGTRIYAEHVSFDESTKAIYADDTLIVCECGSIELSLTQDKKKIIEICQELLSGAEASENSQK